MAKFFTTDHLSDGLPSSSFSHNAVGSFTALLTAADDFFDHDTEADCRALLLPPPAGTLESLVSSSLHSNRISSSDFLSPHVQIPRLYSPGEISPRVQKFPEAQKALPPPPVPQTLESILTSFSLTDFVAALLAPPESHASPAEKVEKKRKRSSGGRGDRRRMISDKIRSLGKLLPLDQKRDTAATLEEAYAYIKFLQAQVQALATMPANSATGGSVTPGEGPLGSLSRQQLLQAVVNSPAAQAILYSKKCCVVSSEQVALLRQILLHRLRTIGI